MSRQARIIFILIYVLTGLGIVMTYSASAIYAGQVYGNAEYYLIRQCVFAFFGTVGLFIAASVPMGFWKNNARALIGMAIGFLIIVYLPKIGHEAGGAQRWIEIGPIHFQPAEFAKIAVILYLADYLSRKLKTIKKGSIFSYLPPLIPIGLVCGLTLLQPDLGSTAFILIMVSMLFFLSGINMKYVLGGVALFIPVLYFLVVKEPYRMSRITAYVNPWDDPQGSGFQIIQSFLAFGLGGIKGAGLGQGIQKLFYLPSSYNDFIFSVIGEELGLIGLLATAALYIVIFICGMQMAERARQDYERLLIYGLTLMIVLQAVIHMLVTTGLVPTKGLPLPFVSYGGTSIVMNMMAVGILLSVDRHLHGSSRSDR